MKTDIKLFNQYGKLKSFGGKTLQENLILTKNAIATVQPYQKYFDRQHSQFQTTFFIIGKHATVGRSIRQICSEIYHKEEALIHNLNELAHKEIDTEKNRELIKHEINKFKRAHLKLDIENSELRRIRALEPIQGCMKDIILLKKIFDKIKSKMSEKDIEEEEVTYWIMRIIMQGMRHVRISGRMDEGNQLALEKMGINPHYVQQRCQRFLNHEEKMNPKPDLKAWHEELKNLVSVLKDVPRQYAKIKNMNMGIFTDAIYEEDFK